MPKITITDGGGTIRDYTSYYDFTKSPYSYEETYDRHRGRSKSAKLTLVKIDGSFVVPLEDHILKIYRDSAGTDLVFGGVIAVIVPSVISNDGTIWINSYEITAVGYDPQTLSYKDVVRYQRSGVKSGQVLVDLFTAYAPWINTANIQISSSPTIRSINISRRQLSAVIQDIIEKTNWSFYIDDLGAAYFDAPANLLMNWGLTEGTKPDYFPEFMPETLSVNKSVQETANDITIIGGPTRGSKVVETFVFNGQDAVKPLVGMPYGLDKVIQFFDAHDDGTIDLARWNLNNPGGKLTEASGRFQVNSGINNEGTLWSIDLFSRDDNVEVRFAELEITSFASGKATLGVRSNSGTINVNQFIHALEFDQAAGTLHTREGSTVTNFAGIPIGVGIYSVRIIVKSAGGAIFYLQGGRTSTPKEYGELGSKTWTRVTETSADTTAFLAIGMRFDTSIGCTVIRSKVSTDINVSVTLLNGGKLGSGSAVGSDTRLLVGLQQALDFETDCFVGLEHDSPFLSFFTDNKPLGTVVIRYWTIDDAIRERVYDNTSKTSVDSRSALTGDDGTRVSNTIKDEIITDSQDARDLAISLLADTAQYQGKFSTTTWHLGNLGPPGTKPISGKRITVNLPNAIGYASFNEVITAVSCTDLGTGDVRYDVSFGEGNVSFDRFMLKLRDKALIDIIDDDLAAVDADSESVSTAATARIAAPEFVSAVFNDSSGVVITWAAVSGASVYEVRDNLYRGQGQGGSLVYQSTSGTSYTISVSNIKTVHKKRSFTFYIWSKTAGGQYSKYPLAVSVENPAPVPQPIRDVVNPNGLGIQIRFAPEVEADILSSGRTIQIATDRAMSSLVINTTISKTVENYDYTGSADTVYYVRYGLSDDFTSSLGDILYSGIREIKAGAADFSGTVQYLNNVAPSNQTTNLAVSSAVTATGLDAIATITFDYTQGANVATHFAIVYRIGGGTPTIADPSILVPARTATGQTSKLQMPHGTTISFAVIPVAVTRGGSTAIGSFQTVLNHAMASAVTIRSTSGSLFLTDSGSNNNLVITSLDVNVTIGGVGKFDVDANHVYALGGADFSGSGASLTSLNASNLSTGTVPNGRFPSTLPAANGSALTSLNASQITTGTLNSNRLNNDVVLYGASAISGHIQVVSGYGLTTTGSTTITLTNGSGNGIEIYHDGTQVMKLNKTRTDLYIGGVYYQLTVDGSGFVKAK